MNRHLVLTCFIGLNLFLNACAPVENLLFSVESPQLPAPIDLSSFDSKAAEVQERLKKGFLKDGYVISTQDGKPTHLGDSALWTMLTAASMSCADAKPIIQAVAASIKKNKGLLVRFEPLPEEFEKDPTSRDMEYGFAFGLSAFYIKCPSEKAMVREMWQSHMDYVSAQGGNLAAKGVASKIYATDTVKSLHQRLSAFILGEKTGQTLSKDFLRDISSFVASSGKLVDRKGSCYPLHLETMVQITLLGIGGSVPHSSRELLCNATSDRGLYLTDWYCGRNNAAEFLKDFKYNIYEYRHQRCNNESPDAENRGIESPGVDFLILYAAASGRLYSDQGEIDSGKAKSRDK